MTRREDFSKDNETAVVEAKSSIACLICRKRKIKCGREVPHCTLCVQSRQSCEYPRRILRSGPKIGSTQIPRKRKAHSEPNDHLSEPQVTRPAESIAPENGSSLPSPLNNDGASRSMLSPLSPSREAKGPSIQSLSFILHPSHESCSPEQRPEETPKNSAPSPQESFLNSSCFALGINPGLMDTCIDRFGKHFTSFQLFRHRDLRSILHKVETATQCKAISAAILIFATKNYSEDEHCYLPNRSPGTDLSSHFSAQALKYVDAAICECEDDPISLPLLQALILVTHWLLIQGVRGRAWRYLGVCVRCAYELNLHLIDADKNNNVMTTTPAEWCEEEERRRAWWAIWEMDVFASVIRRCPTAIDWSQNETFLPADDDKWLEGSPQKSCTLKPSVLDRYKALVEVGNRSPKAWFIVINSLMKDAQKITSPIGVEQVRPGTVGTGAEAYKEKVQQPGSTLNLSSARLQTIQNALRCTLMALPADYKWRNQYLTFGSRDVDPELLFSRRMLHSSIYSIHMISQLTRLMINKYYFFQSDGMRVPDNQVPGRNAGRGSNTETSLRAVRALEEYSEASDEIVSLIQRSDEDHHRYVNPFLANTIWLAGAVQLLYGKLASQDSSNSILTNSKTDLLSMTYNQFVSYWNMTSTMQTNLETVAAEIENLHSDAQQQRHVDRPMPSRRLVKWPALSGAPSLSPPKPAHNGVTLSSNTTEQGQPVSRNGNRTSRANSTVVPAEQQHQQRSQYELHHESWPSFSNGLGELYTSEQVEFDTATANALGSETLGKCGAINVSKGSTDYPITSTACGDRSTTTATLLGNSSSLSTEPMTGVYHGGVQSHYDNNNNMSHSAAVASMTLFNNHGDGDGDGPAGSSPDLLDGVSYLGDFHGHNPFLSTYLGEIFSGSYVT